MELAEKIFGKDLYQVTREDLVEYFSTPREETCVLEFKSGEVKINAIFKEICAFLNTDGGLIIIGSPKERKISIAGRYPKRICEGEPIPSFFRNKNWIESLIAANIVPQPVGIRIQEIKATNGNYFIVDVPQSQKPPHQFLNDGRYYIRMEKEAKPAPHGIVESLFFKQVKINLNAEVHIDASVPDHDASSSIVVYIHNASFIPAHEVSYLIRVLNIEAIQQDGDPLAQCFHGHKGNYELQGKLKETLSDGHKWRIRFQVLHKKEPFILSVMTWHKESGIYTNNVLFDPVNLQTIETYQTGDRAEITLEQLYHNLQDLKNNLV